jgi:hypothetical protein
LFKDPVKNKHLSANLLNRLYTIPGYKISITKRNTDNEELILIKDYRSKYSTTNKETENNNFDSELLSTLMDKVNILTKRLDNVETFLEQLQWAQIENVHTPISDRR